MKLVDPSLEQTYNDLHRHKDKESMRAAAEIAYALGLISKKNGDYESMRKYKEESISLFLELKINSLEDAAPMYDSINNIFMPELIHEKVVERDLAEG